MKKHVLEQSPEKIYNMSKDIDVKGGLIDTTNGLERLLHGLRFMTTAYDFPDYKNIDVNNIEKIHTTFFEKIYRDFFDNEKKIKKIKTLLNECIHENNEIKKKVIHMASNIEKAKRKSIIIDSQISKMNNSPTPHNSNALKKLEKRKSRISLILNKKERTRKLLNPYTSLKK